MLTRRQVLATASAGVGLGGLGFGLTRVVHQGTVNEKWIRGHDEDGSEVVYSVIHDSMNVPYVIESHDEVDLFDGRRERRPTIDAETHEELANRYDTVEYGLNVCARDGRHDCRGGAVSRETFNAVQVGDEATVAVGSSRLHLLPLEGD